MYATGGMPLKDALSLAPASQLSQAEHLYSTTCFLQATVPHHDPETMEPRGHVLKLESICVGYFATVMKVNQVFYS